MLIENKEISVLIESAQDEAFVKLADHFELTEVSFTKHLAQFIITDEDVLSIVILLAACFRVFGN